MNPWTIAAVVLAFGAHREDGGGLLSGVVFPPGSSFLAPIEPISSERLSSVFTPAGQGGRSPLHFEDEISVDAYPALIVRGPREVCAPGVILNALSGQEPKISQGATIWAGKSQPELGEITPAELDQLNQRIQRQLLEANDLAGVTDRQHFIVTRDIAADGPYVIRNYVCDDNGAIRVRLLQAQEPRILLVPK